MTEKAEPMGCDTEAINWLRKLRLDNIADRLAYLSAQEGLLFKCEAKVAALEAELAEVKRPLDAQMERLNQLVISLRADADRWAYVSKALKSCTLNTPGGMEVTVNCLDRKAFWESFVDRLRGGDI